MPDLSEYNDGPLLAYVGHTYRAVAEACIQTIGLRRSQVMLLLRIHKHPGITQIELVETLSMNGGTVSETLQGMEDMGLIIRQRDAEDRRLVRVYLTEAGRDKTLSVQNHLQNLDTTVFDGVPPEQHVTLRHLLHQLLHNMTAVRDGANACR